MLSVVYSSCNGLWVALVKPDLSKPHYVNGTCHCCRNFPGGKDPSSAKDADACDLSGFPGGFGAVYSSQGWLPSALAPSSEWKRAAGRVGSKQERSLSGRESRG